MKVRAFASFEVLQRHTGTCKKILDPPIIYAKDTTESDS